VLDWLLGDFRAVIEPFSVAGRKWRGGREAAGKSGCKTGHKAGQERDLSIFLSGCVW